MKKLLNTIAIVFSLLLVQSAVKAQYMSLGPVIGAGISWLSFETEGIDQSPHLSWNGGLTFIYSTESHIGFGGDLKFSMEGFKVKSQFLDTTIETNVNLGYVRIPLKVIYFFNEYGNPVRPKVHLGLTPGFLASAKADVNSGSSVDVKDQYNSFDLGINLGVGVNFKLAEKVWFNTDVSFYQGLLDATDDDATGVIETNRNGNIVLNAGVAFGFGGE